MRTIAFVVLAALALDPGAGAASPSPAQAARQWTLRMLPTSGSVEYQLATTDTVVVESGGRTTQKSTPLHRVVTRRVTLGAAGMLEVEQQERELGLSLGQGALTLGSTRPPAHFRVKADGEGSAGARLDLVLPHGPVALDARWSAETPPSRLSPFPLHTSYHLEREDTVGGRRCLIITAETTGEGSGGARGAHGTYHAKARLAFDPRAGLVVRAISDGRLEVVEPPDAKGPRRKENHITSHLQLR